MNLVMFLWWFHLLFIAQHIVHANLFAFIFRKKKCSADVKEPWSYRGSNGPIHWGKKYPACNGQRQSPIFINHCDLIQDHMLAKLSMNGYDIPVTRGTIENNGRTIEIIPEDSVQRTTFINGTTYNLNQVHFHWGDSYNNGAEHVIDGIKHSMEMHLIHQNVRNQTAVVAVFFQEMNVPNTELEKIVNHFSRIKYRGARTQLRSKLILNNLLPHNPSSFYRYLGSLTTPGCNEGVIWSLLINPLPVEVDQMAEFRKLYSTEKSKADSNCKLSNNYRPVQPLNYRLVTISQ